MKIIKRDSRLLESELKLKQLKVAEDAKRSEYLESLKGNRRFQEYVVKGIFNKQLDYLTDIRNIKNIDLKNPAEAGNLLFQVTAARKILEKIIVEIS
jgi:hypothetical protein